MEVDMSTLIQLGVPLAAAAAAWGGVRSGLNGMRERVRSIDGKMDTHSMQLNKVGERVAAVEADVDTLKRVTVINERTP